MNKHNGTFNNMLVLSLTIFFLGNMALRGMRGEAKLNTVIMCVHEWSKCSCVTWF